MRGPGRRQPGNLEAMREGLDRLLAQGNEPGMFDGKLAGDPCGGERGLRSPRPLNLRPGRCPRASAPHVERGEWRRSIHGQFFVCVSVHGLLQSTQSSP